MTVVIGIVSIGMAALAVFHAWCVNAAWRARSEALQHVLEAERIRGEAYAVLHSATMMWMDTHAPDEPWKES